MSRLIALFVIFGGIYWLWQRWQKGPSLDHRTEDTTTDSERLTQCPRCDAMLPSSNDQQKEIANSCDHGERCPLKTQQL